MKKILIHSISGNNDSFFNPNERDGYNAPYIYLRERLYEKGYLLESSNSNSLDDCEWVLFYDEPSVNPYKGFRGLASRIKSIILSKPNKNFYKKCIKSGMKNKIALFLWEPPSVLPLNWHPDLHKLFPIIFTWNDKYINDKKFIKIFWPQTDKFPDLDVCEFKQKKLLVNISMNKSSIHPRELYSERLKSIRYFEKYQPDNFDLYGVGWDKPRIGLNIGKDNKPEKYSSYRGIVKNKWDVLPKYKFSLCYENIYGEQGFVTEKIFDSLRSRCVPIYLGASNIDNYVDKDTFIDRRDFKSLKELENYITSLTEKQYNNFQIAIENYLSSNLFLKFLPENFANTIIKSLRL